MSIDRQHAEEILFQSALKHLKAFASAHTRPIYGLGAFCDASTGVIFLVANSEAYHMKTVSHSSAKGMDPDILKWDIGNWEYPGGLFASASAEQKDFDEQWSRIRSQSGILSQTSLEALCLNVLRRLVDQPLSKKLGVQGYIVLGPDDSEMDIMTKRTLL